MPPQAAPFWLCHEVDGVPHCASCNSEFLEILDEEINPDPFHELPHPPTRPGAPPPPIPPRPEDTGVGGGFLSSLFESVFGRLDDPHGHGQQPGTAGPPTVPPRPGTDTERDTSASPSESPSGAASGSSSRGPRTRTYNWGNASFTITTGSSADLFGTPPRNGTPNPWVGGFAGAPGDPNDGLDAYFRGFGAPPPQHRGGRAMRPEEASGQILVGVLPVPAVRRFYAHPLQLQALFDLLSEDGAGPMLFPGNGRFGDYVMTEDGYNDILERLMQAAGPQGPLPASDEVIEGLPKFTFDEQTLEKSPYKDCPVCMEDFVVKDTVTQLPCKHIFHPDCLTPWLKSNGSCPVCRYSLVPAEGNAAPSPQAQATQATQGENAATQETPHRGPMATAQDFLSNSFNMLNRLWGQAGAASSGNSGTATPGGNNTTSDTAAGTSTAGSAEQQIDEATSNLQRAAAEQPSPDHHEPEHATLPEDYHPGVFPGHHPDVPDSPPRRFVRRASTLSNSYTPSDDPPDADLADADPPEEHPQSPPPRTGYSPGVMSGLNSAIPADYRARHAQREREQHEREERERQQATGQHPYWDDDVD